MRHILGASMIAMGFALFFIGAGFGGAPKVATVFPRSVEVAGNAAADLSPVELPEALPCRKDPFEGLQHEPKKFTLLAPCRTAVGRVAQLYRNPDGDIHVHIFPDPEFKYLLNDTNREKLFGLLVTEITPYDQNLGVKAPKLGQRVEVVGAWVLDKYHDWNEIHPVWGIRLAAE